MNSPVNKIFAIILLLLLGHSATARAQAFVQVPYSFGDQPAAFSNAASTDLAHKDCLTANGYGVFTSGYVGAGNYGWYLLADSISLQATTRPTGIVAHGDFSSSDNLGQNQNEIKVTSNLLGQVRYVFPTAARDGFLIRALNDQRGPSTPPGQRQINIEMSGSVALPTNRSVVNGNIYSSGVTISTTVANQLLTVNPTVTYGSETENIVDVNNEPTASSEWWDIACDTKFVYIVWESHLYPWGHEIFVTAVDINSGLVAPGFPKIVSDRQSTSLMGKGRRPTVACDVRANPSSPNFDVAYIESVPNSGILYQVAHLSIVSGVITDLTPGSLVMTPSDLNRTPPFPSNYSNPTHVRMLVSSTPGGGAVAKAIYVIAQTTTPIGGSGLTSLLLHELSVGGYAFYVDGGDPYMPSNAFPIPIPTGTNWAVADAPIYAVANPYDGQATSQFNEFHCLYRISSSPNAGLMIVRGCDNTLYGGSTDTRTCLNKTRPNISTPWSFLPSPTEAAKIAANQMGLHVFWQSGSTDCYARDIRKFDEPIEENTLATYECRVGNGLSHQGTLGAMLMPGRVLTLWTDPNSNILVAPPGIAPSWSNARLRFVDNDAKLQIGDPAHGAATLTCLPNFECWFLGTGQELNVTINSICNYQGVPGGALATNFSGPGVFRLSGTGANIITTIGSYGYPNGISNPANLNIYGGAVVNIPEVTSFISDASKITCRYELGVAPIPPMATGSIVAKGLTSLTASMITSNVALITDNATTDVIAIKNCALPSCTSLGTQFTALNCAFNNTNPSGRMRLDFDHVNNSISMLGGLYTSASIYATFPHQPFEIGYGTFDMVSRQGIYFDHTSGTTSNDYTGIWVHGNDFKTFLSIGANGILFDGFWNNTTDGLQQAEVSGNTFTTSVGFTDSNHVTSAIHFNNTSGGILGNIITGAGYGNGIINESTSPSHRTNTLICNNKISGCGYADHTGAGLKTGRWTGYAKMNRISSCSIGHLSFDADQSSPIFSDYHDCYGPGVQTLDQLSTVSLQGVLHSDYHLDYAAYDTIAHNNTDNISASGQIVLYPNSTLWIKGGVGSAYAENNIVDNSATDKFIYSSSTTDIVAVDVNYWEHNGAVYQPPFSGGDNNRFTNITFTRGSTDPSLISYTASPFSVVCSGGFSLSNPKSILPQGIVTDQSECERLGFSIRGLEGSGRYQEAYDTGRHHLEFCANVPGPTGNWHSFTSTDADNEFRNQDTNRWTEHREWLKKVLYLNTQDPEYYCVDVESIANSFLYVPGRGYSDANGQAAVLLYLMSTGKCMNDPDYLHRLYVGTRQGQRKMWRDTVTVDTLLYPMDTTLPSLKSLGLEILLDPSAGVRTTAMETSDLANIHASQNPFTKESEISVTTNATEVLTYEVYDGLGRLVASNNGQVLEAGEHTFHLDGQRLPTGTYFARFSTNHGLVRSMQLKKLQ